MEIGRGGSRSAVLISEGARTEGVRVRVALSRNMTNIARATAAAGIIIPNALRHTIKQVCCWLNTLPLCSNDISAHSD
jgi:hypothetical protein